MFTKLEPLQASISLFDNRPANEKVTSGKHNYPMNELDLPNTLTKKIKLSENSLFSAENSKCKTPLRNKRKILH